MNHDILVKTLQSLVPGTEWSVLQTDETLTLTWLDKHSPKPTNEELEAEARRLGLMQ